MTGNEHTGWVFTLKDTAHEHNRVVMCFKKPDGTCWLKVGNINVEMHEYEIQRLAASLVRADLKVQIKEIE